jgi:cytochrome d ubiquinol oxidase subunit I
MILLGLLFIGVSIVGIYLFVRKRIYDTRWYLKLLLFLIPLPYLANETGWVAAEVGRQPWAVYKVLRTADAVSINVPAGNILFSLILFIVIYALIAAVGIPIILRLIKKGPEESVSEGY